MDARVADVRDLEEDKRVKVMIDGHEIVLFRHREKIYAFDNWCLHMGGPVAEGILLGRVEADIDENGRYLGEHFSDTETHLVCPWHGWEYDIETGRSAADGSACLKRYEVRLDGSDIHVVV